MISVCFDNASTSSIGVVKRLVVRNAARLAVYEDIIIRAKNHQKPVTIRVLHAIGFMSIPRFKLNIKC